MKNQEYATAAPRREKIYFGGVDLIDTRTGATITVQRVIYRESQTSDQVADRALCAIPRHDRQHYRVRRIRTESAKIIGETA